jgi:hypothetical protein
MESILNAIVAMGVEEGLCFFQMTAKVIVQALRKGKACYGNGNGNACKYESFKANAFNGMVCKGNASYDNASRDYE